MVPRAEGVDEGDGGVRYSLWGKGVGKEGRVGVGGGTVGGGGWGGRGLYSSGFMRGGVFVGGLHRENGQRR